MNDIAHRVVTTLKNLRTTLQGYGDHHLAKDPPQVDKARVNYDAVAEINETLIAMGEDVVRSPDILELTVSREQLQEALHEGFEVRSQALNEDVNDFIGAFNIGALHVLRKMGVDVDALLVG